MQNQYDKMKRKALLSLPDNGNVEHMQHPNLYPPNAPQMNHPVVQERYSGSDFHGQGTYLPPVKNRNHNGPSLSQVVDGMDATGVRPSSLEHTHDHVLLFHADTTYPHPLGNRRDVRD
jgi:hypothetical protein